MKAHDFIQRPDRKLTSRGLWYGGFLALFKFLKCVGIFVVSDLLKSVHVVQLLFLLKAGAAAVLVPIQKPFTAGRTITKSQWNRIVQHSILSSAAQVLWFYGITLCGPLRAVLIFEQSTTVILGALSASVFGSGGPSKVRGALLLVLGVVSLMLLDRDVTVHEHAATHKHHSGLNDVFYHVVNWFGVADHKGGALLLIVALFLNLGQDHIGRKLAVDLGGAKRLHALSTLICAIVVSPFAIITYFYHASVAYSTLGFFVSIVAVVFLVFIADFYAEAVCANHLNSATVARYCPTLCFLVAFVLSYIWFPSSTTDHSPDHHLPGETIGAGGEGIGEAEHGLSGGLIFTLIFFIMANFVLTAPNSPKAHTGQFIGYSTAGMPLYVYGEDFLQRTSQSVVAFVKSTLKQILSNSDSRRIFYFLCINLCFTFVEFTYGIWTNSLGLISDAFHMIFDCSALIMGLVAAVMSTWKRTKQYPFGYGRVEILSGFINGLFLVVIACFIFLEAIERVFEPPEIHTEKLLFVSVAGLCVNLFGMFVFHGAHGHSHGGGGGSHGHSHGGGASSHGTSSGNSNNHNHSHGGGDHGHSHDDDHGHSHGTSAASHAHSHSSQSVLPTHSHGGGGGSHGGHSHSNANMRGVFLHVMADTLGSVGVIISTLLIQYFGWLIADPICSSILAVLIFLSVLPLLKESTKALLLHVPDEEEMEFKAALDDVLRLDGVISYSAPHFWQLKSENNVATLRVQIAQEANQQAISQQVANILRCTGVTEPVVQVEKEPFYAHISALCPSYNTGQRISRKPLQNSLFVKAI